jgi:hypothetical protein
MRTKPFSNQMPDAINCSPIDNYTRIPNELIRSPELSCKAKTVLFILLSNHKSWHSCIESLKKMMKESEGSIRYGIAELEEYNYLLRLRYRNIQTKQWVGSFWAYSYQPNYFDMEKNIRLVKSIGCEIYPPITFPHDENPDVENPDVAFPDVENYRQIILSNKKTKDIIKTKEKDISVPLANFLQKIIEEKKNIHITPMQIEKWARDISKLIKTNQVSYERIRTALRWYKDHCRDEYCPVIESGSSLREKFLKLEAAMEREQNPRQPKEQPHPNTIGYREPNKKYREADRHV